MTTGDKAELLPCPVCKQVMIYEPHDPKEWAAVPEHYDCPHCGTIVQSKGVEMLKRQASGAAVQVPEVTDPMLERLERRCHAAEMRNESDVLIDTRDLRAMLAAAPQKQDNPA